MVLIFSVTPSKHTDSVLQGLIGLIALTRLFSNLSRCIYRQPANLGVHYETDFSCVRSADCVHVSIVAAARSGAAAAYDTGYRLGSRTP